MRKKRTPFVIAALIVMTTLIGMRIWWVNATRIETPEQTFSMNEEVKLNGAFIDDISEDTKDYSLTVKSAQIMSANEYLKRYSRDGVTSVEGGDVPNTRVVLEVEFKNSGKKDGGGFNCVSAWVIGKPNKNTFYRTDSELWEHRETKLAGTMYVGVGIKGGTTYTTYLPFYILDDSPEFFKPNPATGSEYAVIKEKEFYYLLATKPQRMVVDIHV
ncbi:hypothetical protein HMPREF1248_0158 [Coriobacteriaceae bacterium BV3Ac1]|nr:hypothetical protein HMPREF1248_0158 [Coriobacteriaceae bacterium BV3Ac1]